MIHRFLLCSFFMLGATFVTQAQLQKGSWMVNGELRQENLSFPNINISNTFKLLIEPELAYMVTDYLMLGGKLSIGISGNNMRRLAPVAQHLLIRHYFKKLDNFYLFYGGEWVFDKLTITEVGIDSRNVKNKSAYLQSGIMVFLQEAIAIEFLFNYQMISFRADSRSDQVFIDGGDFQLEGRLQFFIHPENKSNTEQADYHFYPGDWLIGGNFQLEGNDFIRPEVYRFWGSGWTTGLRLEAALNVSRENGALGITPIVRKYFRPEKKGKLWLQAGAGIRGNYSKIRNFQTEKEWWITSFRTLSLEGVVGWSNFISPNFTLDFYIARKNQKFYRGDESFRDAKVFSMGLILSGLLR